MEMNHINDYEIIEELFRSTKSVIYRAANKDKSVIIKTLLDEYPDSSLINAQKREYEILSNAKGEGIVRVFGLEKFKNSFAILVEDIGGEDLSKIIQNQKDFSLSKKISIMLKLLTALDSLHKLGIVHNDIKPQNIIINMNSDEIRIIDFENASLLVKQNSFVPLNSSLEGTLAYISPEQTGRINRSVDYRSDYYSLGVTFYQLLTKKLPFAYNDSMELVHAHIAKRPLFPLDVGLDSGLQPTVCKAISDIVMKLLEKNPEDRYQSIAGLQYDLEWCLSQLTSRPVGDTYTHHLQGDKNSNEFRIGTQDFSGIFQIPEKLYGRENEIRQIIDTFHKVAKGNTELLLIAGRSGIGKSALINEINKPITEYRGYFVSGKYDQYKRNIPYYGISQALRSIIEQVMTNSQQDLLSVKNRIQEALGQNGKVMTDLIPELEVLIGEQPSLAALGQTETENRFNLIFQEFIKALCTKEHPMVIFLDDLQWADNSSILLIKTILSNPEMKFFYLILSFRDNEVLPTDPIYQMLAELKEVGISYGEILLNPISPEDIKYIILDTLKCEPEKAIELAKIIFVKTKGNPFFVNETFKSLYDKRLIEYSNRSWHLNIQKIQEVNISENVIDLMIEKIKELSPSQIELLKLAACIGDSFNYILLSQLLNQDIDEVKKELTLISNDGFILLYEDKVRFAHDKIREAIYSLISIEESSKKHYFIGSTILKNTSVHEIEEVIFTIVNQLNLGIEHLLENEKQSLLGLNIQAGNKAIASYAYESALQHFKIAMDLLSITCWEDNYDITLDVYTKLSRLEYLTGAVSEAEAHFELVLNKANAILEKIAVYEIMVQLYTSRSQLKEALDIGLKALAILDIKFSENHDPTLEFGKSFQLLGERKTSDLLDAPINHEPHQLAIMRLLAGTTIASYISRPSMFPILVMKMVNISLEKGNSIISPMGYVMYGNILCSAIGNTELGYAFGKLAMDMVDKYNIGFLKSSVYFIYTTMINHWKNHAEDNLSYLLEGYQVGLLNGNLQFAAYSINHYHFQSILMRKSLSEIISNFEKNTIVFKKTNEGDAFLMYKLNYQFAINLSGLMNGDIVSLNGEIFDEESTLQFWIKKDNSTTLYNYYINKSILHYMFGSIISAYSFSLQADVHEGGCFGMMFIPEKIFWDSMICLKILKDTSNYPVNKNPEDYILQIRKNQTRMKVWAENCAANYGHKYFIIEGGLSKLQDNMNNALEFYDKAILLAKENGYLLEEALANEFLAEIWMERGKEKYADIHLFEAHYAYKKWGSEPKVKQLEEKYPQLKRQAKRESLRHTLFESSSHISETGNFLDLNTVMKASQAISGEIQLGKLLEQLMKILFENAGAQRGIFILKDNDKWLIQAEGDSNTETIHVLKAKSLDGYSGLSSGIVNYVIRTKRIVLLNNASKNGMFVSDEYVKEKQPKSILCYPILSQANIIGVVYLENNLTTDAFTLDRVELLKVLSSQIAISVDNAMLYENLEEKVIERTAQVNEMLEQLGKLHLDSENKRREIETLMESQKRLALVGQLAAGIVHDIKNPMATIKSLAERANSEKISKEKREKNLNLIVREMDRLNNLAYEILDFSKGKLNLELEEVNLKDFLTEIEQFLKIDFDYSGIRCIVENQLEGNVFLDKERMRRVILNLAKNAIEAMYDGEREYKFIIRAEKIPLNPPLEKGGLCISLIDNGPGLPQSVQSRIFQAFATEGKTKGTGLGLFMCKWIVEAHTGSLTYKTKEGEGTTFYISLPFLESRLETFSIQEVGAE